MKKLILLITTLLLSFSFTGAALMAPQDNGEIPIGELKPPGDRPRDECNYHFVCYLIQDLVVLHAGGTSVLANVTIENHTDGSNSSYNTVFGILPVYFPLFGTGDYVITIMLTSGAIYQGVFHY